MKFNMEKQKSKKDLAFDRERAKYRHEISDLQRDIKEKLCEIEAMNQKISELEDSIRQKDEWIERLLEYTELTEENMKNQIQKARSDSEAINHIKEMNNMIFGFRKWFGL